MHCGRAAQVRTSLCLGLWLTLLLKIHSVSRRSLNGNVLKDKEWEQEFVGDQKIVSMYFILCVSQSYTGSILKYKNIGGGGELACTIF